AARPPPRHGARVLSHHALLQDGARLLSLRRPRARRAGEVGPRAGRQRTEAQVSPAGPRLLILEGDGIGPEIVAATRAVIEAADRRFELDLALEEAVIGFRALEACGTTCPEPVIEAARAADGVVLGPVSHNAYPSP